ncbi:hypothetical protein AK812_SmicGene5514 [Symbiodinium microadriaticum]|uniref:Uncharacterized protein n=1 Tax=Symbiodinium microadriaticum TaxID=2951 RepID=A0A1Q9ETJ5_SYMMI|nr:hypothetical protein AK812_SmicGene5514 [Symbiodinium microadriaticum]
MTVCVFAASHPNSSLGTGSLEGVGLRMSADPSCTSAAGFLVEGTQFLGWLQQELGINKAIGTQLWERMSWQRDVINSQRAFEMRSKQGSKKDRAQNALKKRKLEVKVQHLQNQQCRDLWGKFILQVEKYQVAAEKLQLHQVPVHQEHLCQEDLEPSLRLFVEVYRVASQGHLPRKECQTSSLKHLVGNVEAVLKIELKVELQRQLQLLEWLVAEWGFQEVARPWSELKQKLMKVEDLTLAQVETEVQSACDVFKCFDQFDNGQEMFAFLRYFMRAGSALVKPLLEHFAVVFAGQGQWSHDAITSLDFDGFCQVVRLCHRDLQTMASVGSSAADVVDSKVWRLIVAEFAKGEANMLDKEIELLLHYFLGDGMKKSCRRLVLVSAFRIHRIAEALPTLTRAFQVMRLDWALTSMPLRQAKQLLEGLGSEENVNISEDAAKLSQLHGLGFVDELNLQIFDTLLQRVCVFDFLRERGFVGRAGPEKLQEMLGIVQQSLEQDISVLGQALLEELRHCAGVLHGFLALDRPPVSEAASEQFVLLLRSLSQRPGRVAAFDTVAENMQLLGALFDSAAGTGGQLLLFSLQKILGGQLVIDGYSETFCCTYRGSSGEDVVVSATSLSEYSIRSLMSLEGREEQSDEARCLNDYLQKMEAIVSLEGLVATALKLHQAGHPGFRKAVSIPMQDNLPAISKRQLQLLEGWKTEISKTLLSAPILGLVPPGLLHLWLCEMQQSFGSILNSVLDGLQLWNTTCTEEHILRALDAAGIPLDEGLDAEKALLALRTSCDGLRAQVQRRAKGGRVLIQAEALTEEAVLLLVAHLFLRWEGGPNRLPRQSEVLFCSSSVPLGEVEAFLWRAKTFPELLFVLVEPNHLPLDGKKHVAEWLAGADDGSAVAVILTASWHIPSSSHVQQLRLSADRSVVTKWREQCQLEVLLYNAAEPPLGAGVASGKSALIRQACAAQGLAVVGCALHEAFQLEQLVKEVRKKLEDNHQIALHIDLSAYSDVDSANRLLRHLLMCQVLYDPLSGQMVALKPGTQAVEHLERGLNQVRKHYVEETQKTMTFKYSNKNKKWMDVEVDEATFDKHLVPLEDAKGRASDTGMKWEQWVGLVSRGKPESLVLVRLKPQITKRRAPGPGAIRKAEWKPIANRWLQDTCVILHSDSARSYKSKISGVLHDAVVHQKKKVKINGKWVWKLPKYVTMKTHKLPSGRKIKTKAGTQVIDRAWRFLKVHVEVGAVAGRRDVHTLRVYATSEMLRQRFPRATEAELGVLLLYPVLGLIGQKRSAEVQQTGFRCEDGRMGLSLMNACFPWPSRRLHHVPDQDGMTGMTDLRLLEFPQEPELALVQFASRSGIHEMSRFFDHNDSCIDPDPVHISNVFFYPVPGMQPTAPLRLDNSAEVNNLDRSQQQLGVRFVSILADWMQNCTVFKLSDRDTIAQTGRELCFHFVPTYTKLVQDHFCIFVPSLIEDSVSPGESVCARGPTPAGSKERPSF